MGRLGSRGWRLGRIEDGVNKQAEGVSVWS